MVLGGLMATQAVVAAALIATLFLKEGRARQRILAALCVAAGLVLLRAV